ELQGKKPEELTLQQRDELKAARAAQQELEQRTAKLLDQMKKEADKRREAEPELSKKLKEAADQAEKENVTGRMDDAGEQIGQNQLGKARKNQEASAAALESLVGKLRRQTEKDQEQLVRKLREAEKELEKIREEAEKLRQRRKDLQEGKVPGLTDK